MLAVTDNFIVSDEILRCGICQKVVSVGPVLANITGSEYICGRCELDKSRKASKHNYIRQYAYEQFAKESRFPCSLENRGCQYRPKWNEDHERYCPYANVRCPLFYREKSKNKCKWYNNGIQLAKHVEDSHKVLLKIPPVFSVESRTTVFFTRVGREMFAIVMLNLDAKKYVVGAFGLVDATEYRYQIIIDSDDKNNSITLRQDQVISLHDMGTFFKDTTKMQGVLEVDCSKLQGLTVNPAKICGSFGIVKRSQDASPTASEELKKLEKKSKEELHNAVDEHLLVELECPVCKDFLRPPIFICTSGHSVCNKCKPCCHGKCPICRCSLKDTRNYTLENLTTYVKLPCAFKEKGCTAVGLLKDLKAHEPMCKFSGKQCILKCQWYGSPQGMVTHLREKHPQEILQTNKWYKHDLKQAVNPAYLAVIKDNLTLDAADSKQMFRFAWKNYIAQRVLKVTMQHANFTEEKIGMRYNISFKNMGQPALKASLTYPCEALTKLPKDAFLKPISFTYDSLEAYAVDSSILFKIDIVD